MKKEQIISVVTNLQKYSDYLHFNYERTENPGYLKDKIVNDNLIEVLLEEEVFTPFEIVQITNQIAEVACKMFNWIDADFENIQIAGSKLIVDIDFNLGRPSIRFIYEKNTDYVQMQADFPSDFIKL